MHKPTLCPVCRDNRTRFLQIVKLGQEITKDAESGAIVFSGEEWETVTRRGKPDIDLRCLLCEHTAAVEEFERAARRDGNRMPRIDERRA